MDCFVYILANWSNVAIYTGVTNNLIRRVYEHKTHVDPNSFTAKYRIDKLVYYEVYTNMYNAIEREKQIKSWSRKKKNKLVSEMNPSWTDLYPGLLE